MDLLNKLREIQRLEDPPIFKECLQKVEEYIEGRNRPSRVNGHPTLRPVDESRFETVKTQADIYTSAEDHSLIKLDVDATGKK